ncbi:leucine-rich repeat-containing protein kinase family protein [Hydrogenophaga sp. A37]|uniref:leucine-rich repeat-containing protein kinase family protein n=1 Tax=Hydrogenophaga sp. A37 TaxID=1945864 RepID=UPI000986F6C3|nr:leucine-rich repeat-containing protein kinase family protein [Hydrogenophaga sp. A37]OOG87818.1 protein kinase [Hydrogenophaga sp. A37]
MHTLEQLRSGALAGTRWLDLSAGLTELPNEVFALADTLEVLNLSGNRLTSLPHDLSRLHHLKIVFCSDNPFTELPEVLGDCPALQVVGFKACDIHRVSGAALPPALRWLILTDNAIEHLPDALGERPLMQKLMLAGNRLSALPEGLAHAGRLELLRLSANRFEQLPAWLTALPRLSWLALSGNPLGWTVPAPTPLPTVPWADLQIGEALGEGASGRISRVTLAGHGQGLALKLFKGAVTSDGLPEHELAGSLVAGQHRALCTPVAELSAHPQGTPGLLLPLIPPGHVHLAGPPSMASCTRDVYAEGWRIGAAQALRLARTVAGAVAHLHLQGVMHGDLYAHNILWDPQSGDAMLSDFGAATLLPTDRPAQRLALLALEVRAFGCLLEELVAHAQRVADEAPAWVVLEELARACLQTDPALRPTLDDAVLALERVAA